VPTDRAHSLYQNLLPSLETIETTLNEQRSLEPVPSADVFRAGLPSSVARSHVYLRTRGRGRRGSA
jgi:DNA-binding transcriptional LysR family regulator